MYYIKRRLFWDNDTIPTKHYITFCEYKNLFTQNKKNVNYLRYFNTITSADLTIISKTKK